MKTLIISSSVSAKSRSYELCKAVEKQLITKGVEVVFVDARDLELLPYHRGPTTSMEHLAKQVAAADNIIFGMGVHNYSVNDALKIILDNCVTKETGMGKFFGIVCAAGGTRSYLSTMHLTHICMNEWRMIQLPRVLYATGKDFSENRTIVDADLLERIELFASEFVEIGRKLAS